MTVSQAVTARIREILAKEEKSLYRLEMDSGLSKGTFNSLMYNRNKSVNLTTIIVITQTLGITLEQFFASPLFEQENIDV